MKNKIVGGALVLLILLASLLNLKTKSATPDIVFFGDSLIGNDLEATSAPAQLSELSGLTVYNGAFGGTSLSAGDNADHVGNKTRFLNFVNLSEGIRKHDFTDTLLSIQGNKNTELTYFADRASGLNDINFKKVSYIIIEQGTNDYFLGVPIDDEENPYNEGTFLGALRVSIKNIKKGAPKAEIIVLTPCYNFIYDKQAEDCRTTDFGGGVLEDYVNAEIAYCNEAGIAVIDNYHDSLINEDTYSEYLYDGLHTNGEGNKVIADKIWNYICRKNQ